MLCYDQSMTNRMEIRPATEGETEEKTSLESLRRQETALRNTLSEPFADDEEFFRLAEELSGHFARASQPHQEGIERARMLAAAEAVMKKLQHTARAKKSSEFMRVGEKLERAEEEVRLLGKDASRPVPLPEQFGIPYDLVERAVKENYWKRIESAGRHVLALSVEDIASALCRHMHKCDETTKRKMKAVVLNSILESPRPEDIKPETFRIIENGVMRGEKIYIWTVGDEGSYTDTKTHITYHGYDFQRKKLEQSGLIESLERNIAENDVDPGIVRKRLILDISGENKIASLRRILENLAARGITHAYIVDDQQKNIQDADALQAHFPEIRIHTYWLNNASEKGNLAAFEAWLNAERRAHKGETIALILDWDDTLYDEKERTERAIRMLAQDLK